jgi:hypothetical protein
VPHVPVLGRPQPIPALLDLDALGLTVGNLRVVRGSLGFRVWQADDLPGKVSLLPATVIVKADLPPGKVLALKLINREG